jgi:transcriptional regulator with PAS, ATPase and Fis domain
MDMSKLNPDLILALKNANIFSEQEAKEELAKAKNGCDMWLDKYITTVASGFRMKERIRHLANKQDPVLIHGETGTGKELIAHALHGDRDPDKFIPINCAAMPEALLESTLFGHVKGAFTGADKAKTGLLELAKDGTMFLDEIGDMSLALQAKILRPVQEYWIRPVGSDTEKKINCRFVFASHMDLKARVKLGLFREDLYYRISTFVLKPTPLSSRAQDILPLVEELDEEAVIRPGSIRGVSLERFCAMITPDMLEGNVRRLQQIVKRYIILGILPGEE